MRKQFSQICTIFFILALQVLAATQIPARAQNGVSTGIDVLRDDDFALLRGLRVGLVTNQTGIARDGTSTIDILYRAQNCKLVALFGPEHGVAWHGHGGRNSEKWTRCAHRVCRFTHCMAAANDPAPR